MARQAAFEWRLLHSDGALRIFAVILLVLCAFALYNGRKWTGFQRDTIRAVQGEEAERLAAHAETMRRLARGDSVGIQPWTNPSAPSNAGASLATRYAILPPAPLGALAVGQSDLYPYYTKVSTRSKQAFIVNDEIENPVNLLAGRFDLAFVFMYVLPLFILGLSYNVVSFEREQGTLDLLLSQPVRSRRTILTRLSTRFAVVCAVALALVASGALSGGIDFAAAGGGPRLALWALAVLLYASFWFGAALLVNTAGLSSSTNAVALLGVWLAVVVVVPSLYNVAITTWEPSPSRVELTTTLRQATNEANERGNVLLQKYYLDHPEMMAGSGSADMANFAARSIAVQEAVEQSMATALGDFDERLLRQQALADRYRFVSPALVLQSALNDLAGTSVHRYRNFQAQVDTFHAAWRGWFYPRVFAQQALVPADLEQLPRFHYSEEPFVEVARRVAPSLLGLLLPALALGLVGAMLVNVRRIRAVR